MTGILAKETRGATSASPASLLLYGDARVPGRAAGDRTGWMKTMGVAPGTRVLVAGTGPFLLAAAV